MGVLLEPEEPIEPQRRESRRVETSKIEEPRSCLYKADLPTCQIDCSGDPGCHGFTYTTWEECRIITTSDKFCHDKKGEERNSGGKTDPLEGINDVKFKDYTCYRKTSFYGTNKLKDHGEVMKAPFPTKAPTKAPTTKRPTKAPTSGPTLKPGGYIVSASAACTVAGNPSSVSASDTSPEKEKEKE